MEFISNVFYYVVPFLVILGVLVFVHEFGHFIVARLFGVKVDEFSIGFGKKLCSIIDKKGTEWKICLIPLGGYVKMFGDENEASANSGKANELSEEEKKVAFEFKHPLKKLLIVLAGPLFNYLFAIVVFASVFFFVGKISYPAIVGSVMPNSPAKEAGILAEDKVLFVNDKKINSFDDIINEVALFVGDKLTVVIERNGTEITLEAPLKVMTKEADGIKEEKRKMLGIVSVSGCQVPSVLKSFGFFESVKEGALKSWNLTVMTLRGVGQMITGKRGGEDLGGIIRIAEMSGDVSKTKSLADFFMFMAMLSVNLGLINLFPVPVLDGGHIVIYAIETVSRRKVSDKVKEVLAKFGFAVIMALLIFATYNDIIRFF